MSKTRSRVLVVVVVWLLIIVAGAAMYRYFFAPRLEDDLIQRTSAPNAGDLRQLGLSLDSFSGYCVFRSTEFADELAAEGLAVNLVDDAADYPRRLRTLKKGTTPFAVFTIDAYVKACAEAGESPGTIVLAVDESQGADALVALKSAIPDIDSMNRAETRIVTTPDSPSETLFRVVRSYFDMDALPDDCWVPANGAEDVLKQLSSNRSSRAPRAYSLWEPYVSRALAIPGVVKLIDSSKFDGYIIDVLVVQRKFLVENEDTVEHFVKAYLRALHRVRNDFVAAVRNDAEALGEPVDADQAKRLVDGIRWCNTQENFYHFGLGSGQRQSGVRELSVLIGNITRVLARTGAISDSAAAQLPAGDLYYPGLLARLESAGFHPGAGGGSSAEARHAMELPELSADEWEDLLRVGTLRVDRLVFGPGSARLSAIDEVSLREVVATLENWPQYYLLIEGHASARGDAEQNRRLAERRAQVARQFLVDQGVPAKRLRARSVEPKAVGGEHRSVSFVFGELAY